MKFKKETLLLAVVIIGLSAYLITRQTDREIYRLPVLEKVPADAFTKIEISGPSGRLELDREDDTWRIDPEKYPAAKAKIARMLESLENLSVTELVSESGDYPRYELSADRKIAVKAWAGERPARDFEIGKAAPSFRHTFVKLAGDKNVYQARDNFRATFDQSVDNLRDRTVLSFAVSDISNIRLAREGQELVLVRQSEPLEKIAEGQQAENDAKETAALKSRMVWKSAEGRKANAEKMDRLLATLSQLECESYIAGQTKQDFTKPLYSIELTGTKTYSLSIFGKTGETGQSYSAVSSENEYPFLLPEWRTRDIMPAFDDLLEDAAKP